MDTQNFLQQAKKFSDPFRITDGTNFRLDQFDPADTLDFDSSDKPFAQATLVNGVELLSELQEKLYAQDRWALLAIFQALDAAGKDGVIKNVMSGINPQGCEVHAFKSPSAEDLDHDYLWRCMKRLPERGRIGVFNRSYYEETLVVRVHEKFLAGQKLPARLVTADIWQQRFRDISNFETYLANNGVVTVKFFLNVSRDEQKKRFLERIESADKNWKFSLNDIHERQHWDQYVKAYEETIQNTATEHAPWYVVPADKKWFTRLVVVSAMITALDSMDLRFPKLNEDELSRLDAAKLSLEREEK